MLRVFSLVPVHPFLLQAILLPPSSPSHPLSFFALLIPASPPNPFPSQFSSHRPYTYPLLWRSLARFNGRAPRALLLHTSRLYTKCATNSTTTSRPTCWKRSAELKIVSSVQISFALELLSASRPTPYLQGGTAYTCITIYNFFCIYCRYREYSKCE